MKQKFFFYLVIFFVNTSQCMNITSSLHNLEKKLSQLKPFLAKKESQKIESTIVPHLLADLKSYVDATKRNSQNLEQNLKEMLGQVLIKATDPIFKDFKKNFNELASNSANCVEILIKIGNHYKKGSLQQNQKTELSSILGKFKNIFASLENIDLDPFKKPSLSGTIEELEMLKVNNVSDMIAKIELIIQNNPKISAHVTEDSKKIVKLEGEIRRIYDRTLQLIEQIKKFNAAGNKIELAKVLKNLKDFPYDELNSLGIAIFQTKTYASFIKDDNLKKILLTALKSQNLTFSQKLGEEINNIENLFSLEMIKLMYNIIRLVKRLEDEIENAESVLKQ